MHTPGPWKMSKTNGNVICDELNEYHWRGGPVDADLLEANARLIAAAPALLAACKEYIAYREGNDGNIDQIAGRMKAAIRLAEKSADCS